MTKIFIRAISNETVPSQWKVARVTPLHKKGPRKQPVKHPNEGPGFEVVKQLSPHIYSSCCISKFVEKILYEQLYDYLVTNNLLSHHQFGFRRFHSTASVLLAGFPLGEFARAN